MGQFENSGFVFEYNGKRIGKSKMILQSKLKKINSSKQNSDLMFINCKSCGVYMDFKAGSTGVLDGSWICPVCGARVRERTAYNQLNRENTDFTNDMNSDEMPEGCKACGGPWPSCQISCKAFDN